MKRIFSIGPWLMDLFNPPLRESLSLGQKIWRVMLVTVTLMTLCIISALLVSLGFFAWQRSREFLEGAPQIRNGLTILLASVLVNVACIFALLQVKKLDQKFIPPPPPNSSRPTA
jgi:uncharacterized membrane protein YidH (DUF202 family)